MYNVEQTVLQSQGALILTVRNYSFPKYTPSQSQQRSRAVLLHPTEPWKMECSTVCLVNVVYKERPAVFCWKYSHCPPQAASPSPGPSSRPAMPVVQPWHPQSVWAHFIATIAQTSRLGSVHWERLMTMSWPFHYIFFHLLFLRLCQLLYGRLPWYGTRTVSPQCLCLRGGSLAILCGWPYSSTMKYQPLSYCQTSQQM